MEASSWLGLQRHGTYILYFINYFLFLNIILIVQLKIHPQNLQITNCTIWGFLKLCQIVHPKKLRCTVEWVDFLNTNMTNLVTMCQISLMWPDDTLGNIFFDFQSALVRNCHVILIVNHIRRLPHKILTRVTDCIPNTYLHIPVIQTI